MLPTISTFNIFSNQTESDVASFYLSWFSCDCLISLRSKQICIHICFVLYHQEDINVLKVINNSEIKIHSRLGIPSIDTEISKLYEDIGTNILYYTESLISNLDTYKLA